MRFPKPCLTCKQITDGSNYCVRHQAMRDSLESERQRQRKRGRLLYASTEYKRAAAHIKSTATHCHLCGQAFTNRNDITADHINAGDPTSPLAPAHRRCNSSRGNKPLD